MPRILLSLWLLGAALYTVNTLIIADAIDLFGRSADTKSVAAKPTVEAHPLLKPRTPHPVITGSAPQADDSMDHRGPQQDAPREHRSRDLAMADRQPMQQDRQLNEGRPTPSAEDEHEVAQDHVRPDETAASVQQNVGQQTTVKRAVNMRAGPTTAAPTLSIQQAGTELRIIGEDGGWLQVINPDSGHEGWIYSEYLTSVTP